MAERTPAASSCTSRFAYRGGVYHRIAADFLKEVPFCRRGLAEVRVVAFRASQRAGDMPKRVESR